MSPAATRAYILAFGIAVTALYLDLHALDVEELRATLVLAREEIARAHAEIEALRAAQLPFA
jgi:uncharacterized small protein (DUF1192 family)